MDNYYLDKIISLTNAKKIANGWQGHCPAHDDKHPSLSINQSNNGKVLVKCHSGCTQDSIITTLQTLNAWPSKLNEFAENKVEYYYHDSKTDEKILKVTRINESKGKKSIFQQYLDGTRWINGGYKSNVHPYRYHLWKHKKSRIYIVEGEKCVHALESNGLDATTFVGGASGWRMWYSDYFIGRDVVILPDNDQPGEKYSLQIAESIFQKVSSLKIVPLPNLENGEDIFDWLSKGQTTKDLELLVETTADFTQSHSNEEIWEPIKPFEKLDTISINTNCFPSPLSDFIKEVSAATETPTDLAASVTLGVVSLACATSFKIEIKDGYIEPLNLYLLSALESGNRKTSVMNACLEPLVKYEAQIRESEKQSVYEAKLKKRNQEAELLNLRKKLGAKNGVPQPSVIERIRELELNPIEIPRFTRFICADTTPEALANVIADNNNITGIFSDEGGIFQILGGRYSGQIPNLDLILKAHIGSPHRVDRKNSEPILLNEPLVSIALTPQPSVIKSMNQIPEFRERGLFARFLFTLPQSPLGKRTGKTIPISEPTKSAYSTLVTNLLKYRQKNSSKSILKLSEPALEIWQEMWGKVESYISDEGSLKNAKDWGSKLPGHIARICGIFHCIENHDSLAQESVISSSTMLRAIDLVDPLISHACKAFEVLKSYPAIDLADKILKWIKTEALNEFSQRACHYRFKSSVNSVDEISAALITLSNHNYIRSKRQPTVSHRPSLLYEVNPEYWK